MCVYFIGMEGSTAIKVGTTGGDPLRRMAELQTGQPNKLFLIGAISGDQEAERALHVIFAGYRTNGEWFGGPPIFRQFIQHAIENEWPWSYFRAYGVFERLLAELAAKVEAAAAMPVPTKRASRADGWTPEAADRQIARYHRKRKEAEAEIVRLKDVCRELERENARLLANFQQSAMQEWKISASLAPPMSWSKPSAGNGA